MNSLEYFNRDVGSARGRRSSRVRFTRRVGMPCWVHRADRLRSTARHKAQTLTPDMLRPVPGGFVSPQDLPLRKIVGRLQRPGQGDR